MHSISISASPWNLPDIYSFVTSILEACASETKNNLMSLSVDHTSRELRRVFWGRLKLFIQTLRAFERSDLESTGYMTSPIKATQFLP